MSIMTRIKKRYETKPIRFELANGTLFGGDKDLPVFRGSGVCVSCWRVPFVRRLSILFTGRVYLVVTGDTHPPLYVETTI